tara:strand:+ start:120 stop:746 length:627 start_codon:yes stop_codon:yes gene_type:complete
METTNDQNTVISAASSDSSSTNTVVEEEIKSKPTIKKRSIDRLTVRVSRKFIQGGLSNDDFDEDNLNDWRLQHHYATDYYKKWKHYVTVGKDSKFTDCKSKTDSDKKSEGKSIKKTGVTLAPSVDVGAGRKFNEENLNNCFDINSHYYLYDRGIITDTTIEFVIYHIPTSIIKKWYNRYGNCKGNISRKKIYECINDRKINSTTWILE